MRMQVTPVTMSHLALFGENYLKTGFVLFVVPINLNSKKYRLVISIEKIAKKAPFERGFYILSAVK